MRRLHIAISIIGVALCAAALAHFLVRPAPRIEKAQHHAPAIAVRPLKIYRNSGDDLGFVIYFSDQSGWDDKADRTATAIARHGLAVAAVDSRTFLTALDRSKKSCVQPVQPLMTLAQNVQHQLGWSRYHKPILAGHGLGGTLAYASLAQAVPGIFTAGVSTAYDGFLPGTKRWCGLNGYSATKVARPLAGWHPGATTALPTPWRAIAIGDAHEGAGIRAILSGSPDAKEQRASDEADGLLAAVSPFLTDPSEGPLSDLPLAVTPAEQASGSPYFAVVYSGDGGWAGIDKSVAAQFAERGIPAVGIDCLSYFWQARTPVGSAADLERILAHYGKLWHRKKAIVVGYSYGADVLPFIVAKLPPSSRAGLSRLVLLGLSDMADFQFHLGSWLDISSNNAMPTVPQINALQGMPIQCIRGLEEKDSACPRIATGVAQQVALPGGHHFDGNARLLVDTMAAGLEV